MLALKLYDLNKGEIYHPDPLLNPEAWSEDDFILFNDTTSRLLKWKLENLYNNGEPKIIEKSMVLNNTKFVLKQIDVEGVELPEYDLGDVKSLIYDAVKNKLYDDLSYQIAVNILIHNAEVSEIKETSSIEGIFSLQFEQYFEEALKLLKNNKVTYEELDNIVIKKTSQLYFNKKLPIPYIPLLAREHISTPDGNNWHPRLWQLYFLYHETDKKVNLVLSARQSGKTLVSTLVAFQHLMRNDRADILYVVESEDKIEQPFQYFQRGLNKYTKAGIFSVSKSDKSIRCKITGNTLKFMSAGARSGLKSFSAPIVMFDEASFLPSDAYMSTIPIWNKPNGKFYAFTTVDWKAREHGSEWFYELFKSVELGLSEAFDAEDALALKVTIDQNEAISDQEKKIYTLLKKQDIARYLADYYCTLSGDDNLFNKQQLISPVSKEQFKSKRILQAIIGYDPASRYDSAGLVISYVISENDKRYLAVTDDLEIKKKDYTGQILEIQNIVNLLKIKNIPISIIMDFTGVGAGVYEMLQANLPDIKVARILYTAGNQVNYKDGIYYVPKQELVDTTQVLAQQGEIKISYECKTLIEQLDTYRKVGNKYEAITGHDDVIEAFMNTAFFYKNETKKHLKLFGEGLYTNQNAQPLYIPPPTHVRQRHRKFLY